MEQNEHTFEAYFSGVMSEEQVQQFNLELDSNPDLKEAFDQFLAIKKAAALVERDNMRTELIGINLEDQAADNNTKSSNSIKSIITWIAGIGLLLAFAYFVSNYFASSTEPEQMFAQHFETYTVQAARGTNQDQLNTIYTQKNYSDFISSVKEIDKTPEINMMLANAYLETNAFDEAEKALLNISDESSLRDQKYWYLGLLKLKNKDLKQAKDHFLHLRSLGNYKKKEVEKILSNIKN